MLASKILAFSTYGDYSLDVLYFRCGEIKSTLKRGNDWCGTTWKPGSSRGKRTPYGSPHGTGAGTASRSNHLHTHPARVSGGNLPRTPSTANIRYLVKWIGDEGR